jgi:hypothetical protein
MGHTLNYVLSNPNDAADEIDRLRAALELLTQELPEEYHTLDEPDEDWEVVVKMRAIAREALDYGLPTAEDVRGILSNQ